MSDLGILGDRKAHPFLRVEAAPRIIDEARAARDDEALVSAAAELDQVAAAVEQLRSRSLYYSAISLFCAAEIIMRRNPGGFATFNNELLRRARAALTIVKQDDDIDDATTANVFNARGRVLQLSLRWLESAEAFQQSLFLVPSDPSHLANYGISIGLLISLAGPLVPMRIATGGCQALEAALMDSGLGSGLAQDAGKMLEQIKATQASGVLLPCPEEDTGPVEPQGAWDEYCQKLGLLANYCGGCAGCELGFRDADLGTFLRDQYPPGTTRDEVIGYFNQIEEDLSAARYLACMAERKDVAATQAEAVGRFIDPQRLLALDAGTILEKVAFRTAADLLDKIGGFTNAHFGIGLERRNCHFDSVFFDTRPKRKVLRPAAEAACARNAPLSALAEIALDWHDPSRPENGLRRRRNRLVHHYLAVQGSPAPDAAYPHSIAQQDFRRELIAMLRFAKVAAMYFFAALKQDEAVRAADALSALGER